MKRKIEIVTCEDCVHCKTLRDTKEERYLYCTWHKHTVQPTDFCSASKERCGR